MDYTLPIAKRTRSAYDRFYRDCFRKKKEEESKRKNNNVNVNGNQPINMEEKYVGTGTASQPICIDEDVITNRETSSRFVQVKGKQKAPDTLGDETPTPSMGKVLEAMVQYEYLKNMFEKVVEVAGDKGSVSSPKS